MGEHSLQSIPFRLAWLRYGNKVIILTVLDEFLDRHGRITILMTLNHHIELFMDGRVDRQLTPFRVSGGPWKSPLASCRAKPQ